MVMVACQAKRWESSGVLVFFEPAKCGFVQKFTATSPPKTWSS